MKSYGGRRKLDGLTRDATWVAQALRRRAGDSILIPREEIAARVRTAHPGVWKNRSGPHVATYRGLLELWKLGLLTDSEGHRLIEMAREGLRSTIVGIEDPEEQVAAALAYWEGRAPPPYRDFPKGSTSFGLLVAPDAFNATEREFARLATQVRDLRERLVELAVEVKRPTLRSSIRTYTGSVRLLRDIVNLACNVETLSTCFILEAFGVDTWNRTGFGARIARAYPGNRPNRSFAAEARHAGRFLEGLRSVIASDGSRFSTGKGPGADLLRQLRAMTVSSKSLLGFMEWPWASPAPEERASDRR